MNHGLIITSSNIINPEEEDPDEDDIDEGTSSILARRPAKMQLFPRVCQINIT